MGQEIEALAKFVAETQLALYKQDPREVECGARFRVGPFLLRATLAESPSALKKRRP